MMKTYNDLITNNEEIEGEYTDSCQNCNNDEQSDNVETPEVSFKIGVEYKAKIENSLSKLESVMTELLENNVRFKTENCNDGIKLIANVSDMIKSKIFKTLTIESNCVNQFTKEQNTGHSVAKFFFKAIIESEFGKTVDIEIPANEFWFDFDLNDWLVIKK